MDTSRSYSVFSRQSVLTCPPSPMIPVIPDEDDEYTLCAFGDISLSEECFLPSLPSDASPMKGDSFPRPRAQPSPTNRGTGATANRPRPPLLSKTRNPYTLVAKAAVSQPELSLKDIVESMRAKGKFKVPPPIKVVARTSRSGAPSPLAAKTIRTPVTPTTPQSPNKPFRGYGPMPKRPPLPKWDLVSSELAVEQLQGKDVAAPIKI